MRPELGTGFDEVVRRAMALDPDHRFPTAGDFATAARQAASGEAITRPVAIPAAAEEPTRPLAAEPMDETRKLEGPGRDRRSPWIPAAVLMLFLVVGGLAAFTALGGFSSSTEDRFAAATEPPEETGAPSRDVDSSAGPAADEAEPAPPEVEEPAPEGETALTPVTRALYTAEVPVGWVPDEIDERNEARHTSRWLNPDDERVFVLIDAQAPAPDLSPIESAASVRQQTSQTSGYSEIAFEEVEIGGRLMARWVFDLPDDRRIDYFFSECDVGVAVLGAAPASSFDDFEATFESVAASVSPHC